MTIDSRFVLESLHRYLDERPCPGTLRSLQRAVLAKGAASWERNGHWPIVDFPLSLHAELQGETWIGEAIGSACALFYAFADVTDDAQDHDLASDTWKQWGWEQAVNTGTSLLFESLQYLHEKFPRDRSAPIVELFIRAGLEMTYGQHQDLMGLSASGPPVDSYLTLTKLKSGASFGAYAAAVALANHLPPETVSSYREAGEALGGLSQMMSDVYELWGDNLSSDLTNRRLSLPIALGLEQLHGPERLRLLSLLDGPVDRLKQKELVDLLETNGIKAYAKLRIEVYRRRTRELFQNLGSFQNPYLSALIEHPAFPPGSPPE